MTGYEFVIKAAQIAKDDGDHWFRYLNKIINEKGIQITDEDVSKALKSNLLTGFQKVTLKDAVTIGTYTHEYISSLAKPGWRPVWARDWDELIEEIRKKYDNN